ncbi:MAG: hypothetical protein WBP11_06950, partial [Dokdonella sp.]
GSLTAHPCADSELARIHSGHPAGRLAAISPPRIGMKINRTQRQRYVRLPLAASAFAFDPPARG